MRRKPEEVGDHRPDLVGAVEQDQVPAAPQIRA